MRELADGIRQLFRRHPNAAPLLAVRNSITSRRCSAVRVTLDLLQHAGFDRESARDTLGAYTQLEARWPMPPPSATGSRVRAAPRAPHRSLLGDLPDELTELAAELSCRCSSDGCISATMNALPSGLSPARG